MEIRSKGNFENISVGTVIITRRINDDYARRHAHMFADDFFPPTAGRVFCTANSGFLTSDNKRFIVQYPENY